MLNWLRKLGSKEGKEEKMDKAIDGIKKVVFCCTWSRRGSCKGFCELCVCLFDGIKKVFVNWVFQAIQQCRNSKRDSTRTRMF